MYLALLKENLKELFLELAVKFALTDGTYSDDERVIIANYCKEMEIIYSWEKSEKSVDEIVTQINLLCTFQEKKIIFFELIGLAMCDNVYHEKEMEIVELMRKTFGLEKKFQEDCENILKEYIDLQGKINKHILC